MDVISSRKATLSEGGLVNAGSEEGSYLCKSFMGQAKTA